MDIKGISDNLGTIRKSTIILKNSNQLKAQGRICQEVIEEQLDTIWETSMEIQRTICNKDVAFGYKIDALAQLDRIIELYVVAGDDPNSDELAAIGTAAELLAERVRHFRTVETLAGKTAVLSGCTPCLG